MGITFQSDFSPGASRFSVYALGKPITSAWKGFKNSTGGAKGLQIGI
jgi:hypothetical protein